jgi:catechol 2,3-dioxygenase-like lactoylglutathione lyase family enzyme
MIDHISFGVNNYSESRTFYDESLQVLGIRCVKTFEFGDYRIAGYGGEDKKPFFWIAFDGGESIQEYTDNMRGLHFAFKASSVEVINSWYDKCIQLGGKCNGKPGPRPLYHPGYYAAYIVDPNGYRIEAVLHDYKSWQHGYQQ